MSSYQQNGRKNPSSDNSWPASKRPRMGSSSNTKCEKADVDDDPFADDDITGEELEEWELLASQAEINLTQEKSRECSKTINGIHQNGVGNRSTFKMPTARTNHVNNNLKNSDMVKELQTKLFMYEKQVKELEQSYKRKDGETLLLRDKLSRTEKDLVQQKVKVVEIQKRYDDAEVEHDKRMQKEMERYKDQAQFKQAEIMESHNLIKNLEAKNKSLEQQRKSGASGAVLNNRKKEFYDTIWSGSQSEMGTSAKKIRLVKPESPRIQNFNQLNKPSFSDDPLGRKRPIKSSPSKPQVSTTPTSSPSDNEISTKVEKSEKHGKRLSRMKLKSKYCSNGLSVHMTLGSILSEFHSTQTEYKHPLLHLLSDTRRKSNIGTMESLQRLMQNSHIQDKVFENLCRIKPDDSNGNNNMNEEYEILSMMNDVISSYVNLQDTMNGNRSISQDTSSFHTAPSEEPVTAPSVVPTCPSRQKISNSKTSVCKDAYAALQLLHMLTTNSLRITDYILNQSSNMLENLLKICNIERWNPKLEHCQEISTIALSIVNTLAKVCTNDIQINSFVTTFKPDLMVSLITHQDLDINCNSLDLMTTLTHYSSYALSILKEEKDSDTPSLLCHICDKTCAERPLFIAKDSWLIFLTKVMNLLSLLIAEHESMLVENSCYAEIYRAADVVLYNELLMWKKNNSCRNSKRIHLIQNALCLLHSCANVYTDAIPGSRRDHRHQVVLTDLEDFLPNCGDQSSFWSQELNRIVKSEVGALFEEVEIT